ncbi:MAG: hypothetical protein ACREX9_12855, partial [Gammaproteobacteria bacterium]
MAARAWPVFDTEDGGHLEIGKEMVAAPLFASSDVVRKRLLNAPGLSCFDGSQLMQMMPVPVNTR